MAEATYSSSSATETPLPLGKATAFDDIAKSLENPPSNSPDPSRSLLFRSRHTVIVIQGVAGYSTNSPTMQGASFRRSFANMLSAERA